MTLGDYQRGFWGGKSTITALWILLMEAKVCVVGIFMDLFRAFDSVSRWDWWNLPVLSVVVSRTGVGTEVVTLHHDGWALGVLWWDGEFRPVSDRHVQRAQRRRYLAHVHLRVSRAYNTRTSCQFENPNRFRSTLVQSCLIIASFRIKILTIC